MLPEYVQEIIAISRLSNELARSMGLPDCVVPLPGPGSESPAPA